MRRYISLFTAIFLSLSPLAAYGNKYDQMARRTERATWENAKAWAHYLVSRDLSDTLSQSFLRINSSVLSHQNIDQIQAATEAYNEFRSPIEALDPAKVPAEIFRDTILLSLDHYQNIIKSQQIYSWDATNRIHGQKTVEAAIESAISSFTEGCAIGRTSMSADVSIPAMRIPGLGVSTSISPSLGTGVSVSVSYSSGDPNSDWQKHKGPAQMFGGVFMYAAQVAPQVALIAQVVFMIVDLVITSAEVNRLKTKVANAYRNFYQRSANNADIAELYKQYCQEVGVGLRKFVDVVKNPDSQKYATSKEFSSSWEKWVETNNAKQDASCRIGLLASAKGEDCLDRSVGIRADEFKDAPVCSSKRSQLRDGAYSCPQIRVAKESYCRRSTESGLVESFYSAHLPNCKINSKTYECSADHRRDLIATGDNDGLRWCDGAADRAAEEIRRQQMLDEVYAVAHQLCMKQDHKGLNDDQKASKCDSDAKAVREHRSIKTTDELEREEMASYMSNELARSEARQLMTSQVSETSEMLGYVLLRKLKDHDRHFAELANREILLEESRKALRSRLINMISRIRGHVLSGLNTGVLSNSFELREMHLEFVKVSVAGVQNYLMGASNQSVIKDLQNLSARYLQARTENPTYALVPLDKAIAVIQMEFNE